MRILLQLSGLQCWGRLENMLTEMRKRGRQALEPVEDSIAMLEIKYASGSLVRATNQGY